MESEAKFLVLGSVLDVAGHRIGMDLQFVCRAVVEW